LVLGCVKEKEETTVQSQKTEGETCIPEDLKQGMIAFYTFGSGSLQDKSGNGHHLINGTGALSGSDRAGNSNCAFVFKNTSGEGQVLSSPHPDFLNGLNAFSVSLWYQPSDALRADGAFETLLSRDSGISCPDKDGQWSLATYDCGRVVFGRTNSVWDVMTSGSCEGEIIKRTQHWHHIVATFDNNGELMNLYQNGEHQESSSGSAQCSDGTPVVQDTGDLFIGRNFTGKIDDVIIYNRVLSPADVVRLSKMNACCQ